MAKRKRTKGQKDKQRSTKHSHKTKDRVTRTPLKTGCGLTKYQIMKNKHHINVG